MRVCDPSPEGVVSAGDGPAPMPLDPEEVGALSLREAEALARRMGLSLQGLPRNRTRRHAHVVRTLLELQERTRGSLRYEADQMLKLEEFFRTVAEVQRTQAQAGPEELLSDLPAVDTRARHPISQETRTKVMVLLQRARRLQARVDRQQREARREREGILRDLESPEGVINRDPQGLARALHTEHASRILDVPEDQRLTGDELGEVLQHHDTHPHWDGESATRKFFSGQALTNLLTHGIRPRPADARVFGQVFGRRFMEAAGVEEDPRAMSRLIFDVVNFPRNLVTAIDLSASFRQGLPGMVTHPIKGAVWMAHQIRAFGSQGFAENMARGIREDEGFTRYNRAATRGGQGVFIAPLDQIQSTLEEREEVLASGLVDKLIGVGPEWVKKALLPIKASERAYITFLNKQRYDMARGMFQEAEAEGFSPDNPKHHRIFANIAKFVNAATGRGNIDQLSNPVVNTLFFSPRFVASRFEYIYRLATISSGRGAVPRALRREAFRQMFALSTFWAGIGITLALAADIFDDDTIALGTNPFDSDFLKGRVGDTRVDMGGGYAQAIRLMVGMGSAFTSLQEDAYKLDRETGQLVRVQSSQDPMSFMSRMARELIQFKLAPVPSGALSVATGRIPGEQQAATPERLAQQLLVPISLQEAEKIIREHDAWGTALLGAEMLGMGVQVQRPFGTPPDNSLGFIDRALGSAIFGDPRYFNPDVPGEIKLDAPGGPPGITPGPTGSPTPG